MHRNPSYVDDELVHSLVSSIADLVLGRACAGCQTPGMVLCPECRADLTPRPRLRRDLDLSDLVDGLRVPVACSLDYRGTVRHILYRYKDHGIHELGSVVSPALAASIQHIVHVTQTKSCELVISPLPTRRTNRRRRGFDHVRLVGQHACGSLAHVHLRPLLRDVRTQSGTKHLTALERSTSAQSAFALVGGFSPPTDPVILIDDIVTTGSTAREAVATLITAGAHVLGVATISGTP